MPLRFERLADHHQVHAFTCGHKALDGWLKLHGVENDLRGLSRTFLLLEDDNTVVGFYSVTMGGVPHAEVRKAFGEPYPTYDRGLVLIARLAVASDRQGEGFGRDLLADAVERSVVAAREVAAQFVAVDPIDDAARSFYLHMGFHPIEGDEGGRLYVRIDEAIEALQRES